MSLIRGLAAGDIDIAYAPLRLLSFDIETLVPDDGDQPDARYQPVIQIGNMMTLYGIYTPTFQAHFRFLSSIVYAFLQATMTLLSGSYSR